MPKDVTAIEENMINLTCTVISNVSTTVIWKLDTLGSEQTSFITFLKVLRVNDHLKKKN